TGLDRVATIPRMPAALPPGGLPVSSPLLRQGSSRLWNHAMQRRQLAAVGVATALTISGCAALSLFSDTHHYVHGTPEIEQRLHSLEQRVAALESRLAAWEAATVPAPSFSPPTP